MENCMNKKAYASPDLKTNMYTNVHIHFHVRNGPSNAILSFTGKYGSDTDETSLF